MNLRERNRIAGERETILRDAQALRDRAAQEVADLAADGHVSGEAFDRAVRLYRDLRQEAVTADLHYRAAIAVAKRPF